MKNNFCVFTTSLLILLLVAESKSNEAGYKCFNYIKSVSLFYDINQISKRDSDSYTITDATITIEGDSVTGDLYWNYCNEELPPTSKNCPINYYSAGFFVTPDTCYSLSNSLNDDNTDWSYTSLKKEIEGSDGYVITGNNSKSISHSNMFPHSVSFKVQCLKGNNSPSSLNYNQTIDGTLNIWAKSDKGCGMSTFGPLGDLVDLKWLICSVGIVLGLILVPFGYLVFKPALILFSFLISGLAAFGFLDIAWKNMDQTYKTYFIIGFALVTAIIFSIFILKIEKVSYAFSGAFVGVISGMILFIITGLYTLGNGSNIYLYLTVIVTGIIGGFALFYFKKYGIVISTSFGGAYIFIRSIGSWIGDYPNEFSMAKEEEALQISLITTMYWVYLILIIVIGTTGMVYQMYVICSNKKKLDESGIDYYMNDSGGDTIKTK